MFVPQKRVGVRYEGRQHEIIWNETTSKILNRLDKARDETYIDPTAWEWKALAAFRVQDQKESVVTKARAFPPSPSLKRTLFDFGYLHSKTEDGQYKFRHDLGHRVNVRGDGAGWAHKTKRGKDTSGNTEEEMIAHLKKFHRC